jgi:hypothetical protein
VGFEHPEYLSVVFKKPGAQKGQGKWPESEIDRATKIMDEYFKRKKQAAEASDGNQQS